MNTATTTMKAPPAIMRWLILLFVSFAMFGNYYIYDSISPLADILVKQLGFNDENIGLLQGIYSFPNIIMVLIGGLIIDKIGTRKSALIFTLLVFLGAIITALKGNFLLMVTGRLVFGLGAESMIVAITTVIAKWFKGKELSFAFGLNLTVARLGSFLALNSPSWAKGLYESWQGPLMITVAAGIIAVVCLLLFYITDAYSEKKYSLANTEEQDKILFGDVFKFTSLRIILALILAPLSWLLLKYFGFISFEGEVENIMKQIVIIVLAFVFSFLNYKAFSRSFWFITCLCVTFYSAMFPFQTFAIKFFQHAHGISLESAGFLSSILTLSAMIFTPIFGFVSDLIGKRSLLMMIGSLLIVPVYLIMGYSDISLFVPMCIMGIAFSLVPAVMWPSVSLVSKASSLGTAYGLMTMIQNVGLFCFNIVVGYANDASGASAENPGGYMPMLWIFSVCGILGLIFAFMLKRNESGPRAHGLEMGSLLKKRLAKENQSV